MVYSFERQATLEYLDFPSKEVNNTVVDPRNVHGNVSLVTKNNNRVVDRE